MQESPLPTDPQALASAFNQLKVSLVWTTAVDLADDHER